MFFGANDGLTACLGVFSENVSFIACLGVFWGENVGCTACLVVFGVKILVLQHVWACLW